MPYEVRYSADKGHLQHSFEAVSGRSGQPGIRELRGGGGAAAIPIPRLRYMYCIRAVFYVE